MRTAPRRTLARVAVSAGTASLAAVLAASTAVASTSAASEPTVASGTPWAITHAPQDATGRGAGAGTAGTAGPAESAGQAVRERPLLQRTLAEARTEHGVPGMQGTVVRGAAPTTVASGVGKLGSPVPVRPHHRFHLGSLTKAITSTAIGALVERGDLRWDATPAQVFPESAGSLHPRLRDVTLTQLLSHRAGIQPFTRGAEFSDLPHWDGDATQRRARFVQWLLRQPPAFEVGTFHYSNAGYTIAAAMATEVSGLDWETLVQRHVFRPLRMDGRFGWPADHGRHEPWGHWTIDGRLQPADPDAYRMYDLVAPASDVSVSARDYQRFLRAHLRGLQGHDTVLRAETIRRIHTPVGTYALGWVVTEQNGVRTSLHDGTAGTFVGYAAIQPERDLAVATFANAGPPSGDQAAAQALVRLLGEL